MSFGTNEVLKDINLEVEDGEFVIFVGPSGCGKSTLLRIIAGLETPMQGDVEISGQLVNAMPASKRKIAMVFQTYALYPHLTVEKNMSLGLRQAGAASSYIKRQISLAVEMLELEPYLKRKPAELSGGQRQRVAIGRAIVRDPDLFLFDEPLSNLDAALRVNTRVEIARLHRELQSTVIYVTHDQIEAMTLAQKIVVLRDGRIEQVGSPMKLYKDPDNMFVAGFIGSPAMNFIEAGYLGVGGKAATVGVRPEQFTLSRRGRVSGTISHLEHLGAETNIFVNTDSGLITVRQFGEASLDIGAGIGLDFRDEDMLFFDSNGQRLR
jgi:multiple sugar transport system ATP-binding protein